jgi:hypothetical protein
VSGRAQDSRDRRITPADFHTEREHAIAVADQWASALPKDQDYSLQARQWVTRWTDYVRHWRNPLVAKDVEDILQGDAHLETLVTRRRRDPRADHELAAGWFVEEAAVIGADAYEHLFRGPDWSPSGLVGQALVEHREDRLRTLGFRIDGRIRAKVNNTLPPLQFVEGRDPDKWAGSHNARTRQIKINSAYLDDEDAWRASATLIHELAHDMQDYRRALRLAGGRLDPRSEASMAEFIAEQDIDYVTEGDDYYRQATEDDAFRRDGLATLKIALMSSGHPEHWWLPGNSANWIQRVLRGKA